MDMTLPPSMTSFALPQQNSHCEPWDKKGMLHSQKILLIVNSKTSELQSKFPCHYQGVECMINHKDCQHFS